MFILTEDDIKSLNDVDLREIVGHLCKAEVKSQNISDAHVLFSGHQKAADGGIDVDVNIPNNHEISGYIPRLHTGIQVKENALAPQQVYDEMYLNEELRDSIIELIQEKGAYIIASGNASATTPMKKARVDKMKEAVHEHDKNERLHLDFYDAKRIANWANNFPSMIIMIKEKLGKASVGWKPYQTWSNTNASLEDEYQMDDEKRVVDALTNEHISVEDALNRIRGSLTLPKSSIRLVGLSGVGKTRFVQAIFDKKIGEYHLDENKVIYTDISFNPTPTPQALIKQLIAERTDNYIIVDNCPPDIHRVLSKMCQASDSKLHLMTIEYDIREDQPEETQVYRLNQSSVEIIKKMLMERYKNLIEINASRIAKFSDGNARIAICLANSVVAGLDISTLNDNDLFERLFYQRNQKNDDLLHAAEGLALVYSFNIDIEENDELSVLAEVLDLKTNKLFRYVNELAKRGLIQSRGDWRAVLPHPVSNRLATCALENIPNKFIINTIIKDKRLFTSFAKRLGYLHQSDKTKKIVEELVSEKGILGDLSKIPYYEFEMLSNITSANPEAILTMLEREMAKDVSENSFAFDGSINYRYVSNILFDIAYDADLFERAMELLAKLEIANKVKANNTFTENIRKLFQMILSGTHASIELRIKVINKFLSRDDDYKDLAIELLKRALFIGRYFGRGVRDFGSRNRDYGLKPNTTNWLKSFIDYTLELIANGDDIVKEGVKRILAVNIHGLLEYGYVDYVEDAVNKIAKTTEWETGYVAITEWLQRTKKDISEEIVKRLSNMLEKLEPKSNVALARVYVLSEDFWYFHYIHNKESGNIKAEEIGLAMANNPDELMQILPTVYISKCEKIKSFCIGLAKGVSNPYIMWKTLKTGYLKANKEKRNNYVLGGFIQGLQEVNPKLVSIIFNEEIEGELVHILPWLQCQVKVDDATIERMIELTKSDGTTAYNFECLGWLRNYKDISDSQLLKICQAIFEMENGVLSVIAILSIRTIGKSKEDIDERILELGRKSFSVVDFNKNKQNWNHICSDEFAKMCFYPSGTGVEKLAYEILENEINYFYEDRVCFELNNAVISIGQMYPYNFLDLLLNRELDYYHLRELVYIEDHRGCILHSIDIEHIITWCNSEVRKFTRIAEIVTIKSDIAYKILGNAPDKPEVLKALFKYIGPKNGWIVQIGDNFKLALEKIEDFVADEDNKIKNTALEIKKNLKESYQRLLNEEEADNRHRNERF